jgi:hypothetical protein
MADFRLVAGHVEAKQRKGVRRPCIVNHSAIPSNRGHDPKAGPRLRRAIPTASIGDRSCCPENEMVSRLFDLGSRAGREVMRFSTVLSVRARIAALAAIPVIGMSIIGLAYLAGQREVATAFDRVTRASSLADASRELRLALADIRISARDFSQRPSEDVVTEFNRAYDLALSSLQVIELQGTRQDRETVADLWVHGQRGIAGPHDGGVALARADHQRRHAERRVGRKKLARLPPGHAAL